MTGGPARIPPTAVVVEGVSHMACPSCGEVVLAYDESRALQARAIEAYRRSRGLLGATDVRDLRQRIGLTWST